MQLILFDDHSWENLLPLTFTRPVSDLRIGILTIAEKWERAVGISPSVLTRKYLRGKFPCLTGVDNLMINSSLLPFEAVVEAILNLKKEKALVKDGTLLAVRTGSFGPDQFKVDQWLWNGSEYTGEVSLVNFPWQIFSLNGQEIEADFKYITRGRTSEKLSDTMRVIQSERVFVEPGFAGEYSVLNATKGPIFLGA